MDFRERRNSNPAQHRPAGESQETTPQPTKHNRNTKDSWLRYTKSLSLVLLFSGTILLVALLLFLAIGGKKQYGETAFVNTEKLQAVFLNGGQVYFGNITTINRDFVTIENIFYLEVNQQVQPGEEGQEDITLVKLGCELHGPEDKMVINQDHIKFWENLKDDGRVAQAVEQFEQNNPDGIQCDEEEQPTATPDEGGEAPAPEQQEDDEPTTQPQDELQGEAEAPGADDLQ